MAFLLKRDVRGFRGFPNLVARGICMIRGTRQDILFADECWESLYDHASHSPLVSSVRGRLIKVDRHRSLKINDHWRKILFSGLVHSFICKVTGDRIHEAFNLDNVGVIRGLNILGFRRFDRRWEVKNDSHDEYVRFVKNLFSVVCDPWTLQQVLDMDHFLQQFDGALSDDCMLGNPMFLDDEETASFYLDVHRLVRNQFPVRGAWMKSKNILLDMEKYWANDVCVQSCEETFFKYLLGSHEKKAEIIKKYKEPASGSAVIDIPRIIVSHCIERDLLDRARKESVGVSGILYDYDRPEVIEGARIMFSLYPQEVVSSFEANGVWPALRMTERLPIPSIYNYVPPYYGHVHEHVPPYYGHLQENVPQYYGHVQEYVPPYYGHVQKYWS